MIPLQLSSGVSLPHASTKDRMATWQADFDLEPDLSPLPSDFRARLDLLLPPGRTWSEHQEAWGAEDSDRIEVWHDPRGAVEIRCRIDARKLDPSWLERFLEFVRYAGRRLQTPDGRVVDATLGELTLFLRGSPAWRFVADPKAYLHRLRVGGVEDA